MRYDICGEHIYLIKLYVYQYNKSHSSRAIPCNLYLWHRMTLRIQGQFFALYRQTLLRDIWAHGNWHETHDPGLCACLGIDSLHAEFEGMLPKGPYRPCVSKAVRARLAGYHRIVLKIIKDVFPFRIISLSLLNRRRQNSHWSKPACYPCYQ